MSEAVDKARVKAKETCRSCASSNVEDASMTEDGVKIPVKHCKDCLDWW